jgi:DNA invertase Pin-like site-specific DNA recombinase
MFQITGAFAEFERSMIRTRVNAGLKRARDQIKRDGHFVTRNGQVRKRLGPPSADPGKVRKAQAEFAKGHGIIKVAKAVGLGVGTVAKLKCEMGALGGVDETSHRHRSA